MTRDDMVAYVCDRLSLNTGDTTRVASIAAMCREVHAQVVSDLALMQSTGTLAISGGDPQVTLPEDWVRTRAILRDGCVLTEVSWRDFMSLDAASSATGVYTMDGPAHIQVFPTPSTAEAATIWYDAAPAAMSSGSDTPQGIPVGYQTIIPELVIHRVALAEEEPGLAQAAKAIADEMLFNLRALANRRGGSIPAQLPIRRGGR